MAAHITNIISYESLEIARLRTKRNLVVLSCKTTEQSALARRYWWLTERRIIKLLESL